MQRPIERITRVSHANRGVQRKCSVGRKVYLTVPSNSVVALRRGFCCRQERLRINTYSPCQNDQFHDIDPTFTALYSCDE